MADSKPENLRCRCGNLLDIPKKAWDSKTFDMHCPCGEVTQLVNYPPVRLRGHSGKEQLDPVLRRVATVLQSLTVSLQEMQQTANRTASVLEELHKVLEKVRR